MNVIESKGHWRVGVARRKITPSSHVDLAGLGYYLNRTGQRVRDDLTVTGLVLESPVAGNAAFATLDIMYASQAFARAIRSQVATRTKLAPGAICVNCSHSHNAPTAAEGRGLGELNHAYIDWVVSQTVEALVEAWRLRTPATLHVGAAEVTGLSFNRTRENGPFDSRLSVLRADTDMGRPLAVMFNFHAHLTAHLEMDLRAISRDWPGEAIDQIEAALPGVTAMYLQGTCGDIVLDAKFNATERRFEPARVISAATLTALAQARPVWPAAVAATAPKIRLPTRRWTRSEIAQFRDEGRYRLETGDINGWLDGIARVIVTYPDRLPGRYGGSVESAVRAVSRFAVEWADATLQVLDSRPEYLETEVQAIRVGDVFFTANSAELFTTLGLEIRKSSGVEDLFMASYANGNIGYLPDAFDVERKSYAAIQSPKFTGQFPFVSESGRRLVAETLDAMRRLRVP
ncbi:MAG: hypothetical protein ACRED1_12230 [Limisphaerales bacterium]